MTDYIQFTGSSGAMMIRDTGSTVEFWLTSNNTTTYNYQLPWGYTVNGATGTGTFRYEKGAGWQRLGYWTVTTSQNVTFRIFDTGTSGFGGPTTFTHFIDRATVPAAPSLPIITEITSTSAFATFTDGANGGAAIDSRQLGYSTDPAVVASTFASDGSDTISPLTPGVTYYVWARTHNAKGYSAWSARASFTTLNVPDAPSTPVISNVLPTSVDLSWTTNGTGGTPITNQQIGYGTDPETPSLIISATSPKTVTGLTPGTVYYFWVRAVNSVGNGPWSAAASIRTIAGARILVGGVWKIAVPYVKVSGTWVMAVPWVKNAGIWRQTI